LAIDNVERAIGEFELLRSITARPSTFFNRKLADAVWPCVTCLLKCRSQRCEGWGHIAAARYPCDADLKTRPPILVGGTDGARRPLLTRAKHHVIDRRPPVVGVLDISRLRSSGLAFSRLMISSITFRTRCLICSIAAHGTAARQALGLPRRAARLQRRQIAMNCLALFSRKRSSAKLRQASRDMRSAAVQALPDPHPARQRDDPR